MTSLAKWLLLTTTALAITGCGGTVSITETSSSSGVSSSSSGISSSSSGGSSSTTSSTSSSSGWASDFSDESLSEQALSLLGSYIALNQLGSSGPALFVDSIKFESLIRNGVRKAAYDDIYLDAHRSYMYQMNDNSSSISSSSSSSSSGSSSSSSSSSGVVYDTIPTGLGFQVASPNSAPSPSGAWGGFNSNFNDITEGDYWFVSDVSPAGSEINFEIFELDTNTAQIHKKIDYKGYGSKGEFLSAMGLSSLISDDGAIKKLALLTTTASSAELNSSEKEVTARLVSIENETTAQERVILKFPGELLAQHRVGNILHIISRRSLTLEGLEVRGESISSAILANEQKIAVSTLTDLLPDYKAGDNLISLEDNLGYSVNSLLKVTAIDMTTDQIVSNAFLALPIEGIYLEGDKMYTWSSRTSDTSTWLGAYQFGADGLISLAQTPIKGKIVTSPVTRHKGLIVSDGSIIAVTNGLVGQINVQVLTVDDQGQFSLVGQLPESEQVVLDPGFKPFSVTYSGNKVIVTTKHEDFFQYLLHGITGPTYIFEASSSSAPKLLGQLNLDDFATFTQVLDNRFLLAVHRSGGMLYDSNVSLWDTEDLSTPIVSESFSAPEGQTSSGGPLASSPANMSQSGVSVAAVADGSYRVAVPIDFAGYESVGLSTKFSVEFFEISGLPNTPQMTHLAEGVAVKEPCTGSVQQGFFCVYKNIYSERRTYIKDDAVFYLKEATEDSPSSVSTFKWGDFDSVVQQIFID